jgi:hypothetical protein
MMKIIIVQKVNSVNNMVNIVRFAGSYALIPTNILLFF